MCPEAAVYALLLAAHSGQRGIWSQHLPQHTEELGREVQAAVIWVSIPVLFVLSWLRVCVSVMLVCVPHFIYIGGCGLKPAQIQHWKAVLELEDLDIQYVREEGLGMGEREGLGRDIVILSLCSRHWLH